MTLAVFGRARASPSIEAAHARARSSGAALIINARDIVHSCRTLTGRITIVLTSDPRLDGVAEICSSCGSPVLRWKGDNNLPAGLDGSSTVPTLVVLPGFVGINDVAELMTALARPAVPITFSSPAAPLTWKFGLPTPVALNVHRAVARSGPTLTPPGDAISRAHLIDRIERFADDGRTPRWQPPAPPGRSSRVAELRFYAAAMSTLSVLSMPYLLLRVRAGKEELRRLGERRGRTPAPRPEGRLVWIHAASVGESLSVLPLVREIRARGHTDTVLMTTGTLTSAHLVGQRADEATIHQYIPLDVPRYVRRFLCHWRPDAALFVESELWPNMMLEIARTGLPFSTVNGRMSERALLRWKRWPGAARAILRSLNLVLAQTPEHARRFALLGARDVRHVGNLKFDCPAPPFPPAELEALRAMIAERPIWLAASTHPGEEAVIAEAHFAIRERYPDLLTILVPRHPERGAEIAKLLEDRWLVAARRSQHEEISAKTDIYLADTLGELGLFYRLAPIAFVGGSLVAIGGHNPIEPAQLDCAIVHGPHVQNFADTYNSLGDVGGAVAVASAGELAGEVTDLISNTRRRGELTAASRTEIERNEGSLERALAALAPQFAS